MKMAAKRGRPKKTESNKAFKLKPSAGYIMIQQMEAQMKTASGIYLPDSAKEEKPQKGEVIAVGGPEITDSGTKREAPVKTGDKVIYKKWGGNEVKLEGKEVLFIKFEDILAIETN